MDRALDLKPETNGRLWVRIPALTGSPRLLPGRCTVGCPLLQVCALGWVKCREHISLLIILCIIVYVTNKAHQSKCNHWIHALLGYSHSLSCAFKSECENRTLRLLQRFVGLVLLELSELSSCAFSQSGNYFAVVRWCGAGDDASYVRFGETKDKYLNRSLRHGTEMRHRNLRSDSVRYILVP